ncbi:twitching motility protein PilT [bacterium SM23_31]|nr:MAG: twitching motility protein PilT [bacterium SM23_31]
MPKTAEFRFYEELNDFLPVDKRKSWLLYDFMGKPTVKDAVESIGVPHTEIDLILVNSKSVTFSYHLKDGDKVSVYPVFESLDISNVTHLREKPLRKPKYILDVQLGKLAKYLRMLGFDTLFENNYDDSEIVKIAKAEKRTILTRDVSILKIKAVTHGYWIRSQKPTEQITEVITRFDLYSNIKPLSRCIACNGIINKTTKESVIHKLQPKTKRYYNEFYQCKSCKKVYWKGSHYYKIKSFAAQLRKRSSQKLTGTGIK